jgi:hypothetical protein
VLFLNGLNQILILTACRCGNEERLCFGNGESDNSVEDTVSDWHEGCDSHVSSTITTPALSTITASYDARICTNLVSWCGGVSVGIEKCTTDYTSVSDISSCLCAPPLLSLEYSCMYVGNASCIQTNAALSNIPAYSFCSNFESVLGNLPNVQKHPNP